MRKILSIMLCALLLIGVSPLAVVADELNENVDEAIATDVTDEAQAEDSDIVDVAEVTLDEPAEENVQPLTMARAATNGYSYTIETNSTTGEKYAVITKYNGSSANLTIPSTLAGYPVKKIGDSAFNKNQTL